MKNGIWQPADFDGKNAGEEKTKEKQQLPSHMSRERGHQRYWQPARGILRIKLLRKPKRKTFRCIRIISWQIPYPGLKLEI